MKQVCPLCNNKRHIFDPVKGWVRCSCVDELRILRIMTAAKFPPALIKLKDSDFKMNTSEQKRLGLAIKGLIMTMTPKFTYIYSSSPVKEKVSAIITRYAILNNKDVESARYLNLGNLTESIFDKDQEQIDLSECDILVLSIGKEITNSAHRSTLYNTLYDRLVNEAFTIVLSSVPKQGVISKYGEEAGTLIKENFEFFEC